MNEVGRPSNRPSARDLGRVFSRTPSAVNLHEWTSTLEVWSACWTWRFNRDLSLEYECRIAAALLRNSLYRLTLERAPDSALSNLFSASSNSSSRTPRWFGSLLSVRPVSTNSFEIASINSRRIESDKSNCSRPLSSVDSCTPYFPAISRSRFPMDLNKWIFIVGNPFSKYHPVER